MAVLLCHMFADKVFASQDSITRQTPIGSVWPLGFSHQYDYKTISYYLLSAMQPQCRTNTFICLHCICCADIAPLSTRDEVQGWQPRIRMHVFDYPKGNSTVCSHDVGAATTGWALTLHTLYEQETNCKEYAFEQLNSV